MGWDPTSSIFAMAAAPAVPILLDPRSTLVTEVFVCQKMNKKTRLPGVLTGVKMHLDIV